jgi:hypothetical protein
MKATKAIVQLRVDEILAIRLDGAEFWDVREYAREKEQEDGSPWKLDEGQKPLCDGQLWRYIARADKMIGESCRASRKKLLRRHLAQRRSLYAKSVSSGDFRAALACLRDEAELQGLYDPQAAPLDPKEGEPRPIQTTADVVKLLGARLAQLDRAELGAVEKSRLTATLADAMLRAIGVDVIDKRLEALQAVLSQRDKAK